MIGNHTRRTGSALRTLQMAASPCPAKPSGRAATKRASLNDQFQAGSAPASRSTAAAAPRQTGQPPPPLAISTRGGTANQPSPAAGTGH